MSHLVYYGFIFKDHTGPEEFLHVGFHLDTTGDDARRQVVIDDGNLCKESTRGTAHGDITVTGLSYVLVNRISS